MKVIERVMSYVTQIVFFTHRYKAMGNFLSFFYKDSTLC